MALQVIPILRALAPLIAGAGEIVARYRTSDSAMKIGDRLNFIEQEALRTSEILRGVTEQLEAVAQELRRQAEQQQAQERRIRLLTIVAASAAALALGAAVVAFVR